MSLALTDRRVDVLLRQFDGLLERGKTVEEALDALNESIADDYQPLLASLGEVVHRAQSGIARDPGALAPLNRALILAGGAGARAERTLQPMLQFLLALRDVGRQARSSFLQRLGYTGLLALVGLVLALAFAFLLQPAQVEMMQAMDYPRERWPVLISVSPLIAPAAFGAILLGVILAAAIAARGTGHLARGRGDGSALRYLPGFGRLQATIQSGMAAALCRALLRAGADAEWVMEEARRLPGRRHRITLAALELAARTGNLEEESAYQAEQSIAEAQRLVNRAGNASIVGLKVLVMAALAYLIVSLYAPIMTVAGMVGVY